MSDKKVEMTIAESHNVLLIAINALNKNIMDSKSDYENKIEEFREDMQSQRDEFRELLEDHKNIVEDYRDEVTKFIIEVKTLSNQTGKIFEVEKKINILESDINERIKTIDNNNKIDHRNYDKLVWGIYGAWILIAAILVGMSRIGYELITNWIKTGKFF